MQNSGGEPSLLLSPPHPLSHWVEITMHRLHLLDPLPSPQHTAQQAQPESLRLTLTLGFGSVSSFFPFSTLWKFYPPPKAQLKHCLLQAVFLGLPLPYQLHSGTPWLVICLLEVWGPEGLAGPLACRLRYTQPSSNPHTRGFQNKGPDAIKIQLNSSLL